MKDQIASALYEQQIGLSEMVLDGVAVIAAMYKVRGRSSASG